MMYCLGWLVLCSLCGLVTSAPENYILNVSPGCGVTANDTTTITIRTDFDVSAVGLCNGNTVEFIPSQRGVVHTLSVSTSTGSPCLFFKKENADVYTVMLEISYGEPGAFIHTQQQTYLITCTYDRHGLNIGESANRMITEPYIQPQQIQEHKGTPSSASFSLKLLDVLDREIFGSLPIGRKVRLFGELTGGAGNELGLRAVSCAANNGLANFEVLRGGCGDGVVFRKTNGFTTKGLKVYSPYFGAFKLAGGSTVQFTCNFTVCSTDCDGSSCTNERKRRETGPYMSIDDVNVLSPYYAVQTRTCAAKDKQVHRKGALVLVNKSEAETSPNSLITTVAMAYIPAIVVVLISIGFLLIHMIGKRSNKTYHVEAAEVVKPKKKSVNGVDTKSYLQMSDDSRQE